MENQIYTEDIDFQKYWLVLKRHWLPSSCVFLLIFALAFAFAYTRKPTYEASGKLLIKKRNTTSALVTEAGAKLGELDSVYQLNSPLDTEAEIISSTPIIEQTIAELQLKGPEGNLIPPGGLLSGLGVKGIKGTDVLLITYQAGNPEEAATVVNKVMEVYIENNILVNRSEAAAAREFINKELPEIEARLSRAEAELRNFKERNNIVELEEEARSAVFVMGEIETEKSKKEAALADATARSAALQQQMGLNSAQAIALGAIGESMAVQNLFRELQQVENDLAVQRTRYQSKHPIIANLTRKRVSLQALLQERIRDILGSQLQLPRESFEIGLVQQQLLLDLVDSEVQRLGLVSQVRALEEARYSQQQRANVLPRLQEGLRELERKVNAAQSTYEILLKNLQEVQIVENQNVGNARVIASASPPEFPVGSGKKLYLAAGIVAGGMLYVVTAFLLELIDPSIKTAKEVREVFRYTVLGMIPKYRKKGFFFQNKIDQITPDLPVRDRPHWVVSETYRMLQANLRFLSPDKELKTIVVTSSMAKEGKSAVAANLALAIAQLGRRVLLIDADLRHPIQHHIWDLTNIAGLSDAIVGQVELDQATLDVSDNLDVLPSGVIPPNALALLDSKRMAGAIEQFAQDYDFILIDTPPLVMAADALTVGKMSDGIVLVVRPGAIDRVSAAASQQLLRQSGVNVLGIVVNGVIMQNEPDSYFHHAQAYYKQDHPIPMKKMVAPSQSAPPQVPQADE
ncbi:GumC family protein [Oxynema aestuarii]|uniref:non-specific protein-tyrosine kinase n=1 Tax=Oxynema aestuarii AP17 TaxID=2064643 RepID=A0A6H1TSJ9_9CYAN|nr:polysaccharide biosynthesis tyrosine autokinase [Oxynema aestuarii]QIZ69186.1 polysaccharide biosynthesis tyrosine autokinase [Oxynema aestuarii AP17]